MRDVALIIFVLLGVILTLRYPFVGVLLWTWFSVASPHQEAYGFSRSMPLNLIVAIAMMGSWFFSKDRSLPAQRTLYWLILSFLVWMTFNSFFAVSPNWSWQFWDRFWKIFVLGLFVAAMTTNRVRLQSILWIIVISLFYYGVKGGIFVLVTGGGSHVIGPPSSIIGDNNQLALALLMSLPLANYLRVQSSNKYISNGILIAMPLVVIAIVGTYSRGGMLGLAALSLAALMRVRNRFLYIIAAAAVIIPVLYFMPEQYIERLHTISNYSQDASVQGRLAAWRVAYLSAVDHFPFGAGFYGPQLPQVFNYYFPKEVAHAAHSIYFQVLGENGFIGLGLYLAMIITSFIMSWRIIRAARGTSRLFWVRDMAAMIQMSQFVFCFAGAALSMAYYDVFVLNMCLLLPLDEIVRREKAKGAKQIPALGRSEAPVGAQPVGM